MALVPAQNGRSTQITQKRQTTSDHWKTTNSGAKFLTKSWKLCTQITKHSTNHQNHCTRITKRSAQDAQTLTPHSTRRERSHGPRLHSLNHDYKGWTHSTFTKKADPLPCATPARERETRDARRRRWSGGPFSDLRGAASCKGPPASLLLLVLSVYPREVRPLPPFGCSFSGLKFYNPPTYSVLPLAWNGS